MSKDVDLRHGEALIQRIRSARQAVAKAQAGLESARANRERAQARVAEAQQKLAEESARVAASAEEGRYAPNSLAFDFGTASSARSAMSSAQRGVAKAEGEVQRRTQQLNQAQNAFQTALREAEAWKGGATEGVRAQRFAADRASGLETSFKEAREAVQDARAAGNAARTDAERIEDVLRRLAAEMDKRPQIMSVGTDGNAVSGAMGVRNRSSDYLSVDREAIKRYSPVDASARRGHHPPEEEELYHYRASQAQGGLRGGALGESADFASFLSRCGQYNFKGTYK